MSHFSTVILSEARFQRMDVLRISLTELGYTIIEESTLHSRYGSHNGCSFKIAAHGIEIGFTSDQGAVCIIADWFDAEVTKQSFATQLKKAYAENLATTEFTEKGFRLVEQKSEEGVKQLVFRRLVA